MSPPLSLRATLALSLVVHVGLVGYALVRPVAPAAAPEIDLEAPLPAIEGDTFATASPTEGPGPGPAERADPAPSPAPAPKTAPAPVAAHATPRPSPRPPATASGAATEPAREPVLFGAAGERGAADLATTFARAIPQAASADPAWHTAPFGDAGTAVVVFELDASGALVRADVGGAPGPALRRGIERTLALVRGRAFHAPGPVVRVRVTGRVSPDAVHDESNAAVFALGASYVGGAGNAFFSLSSGRRVDLDVREVAPAR